MIYDLGLGSAQACPRAEDAFRAAEAAGVDVEEGSVGAGTGATVGKLLNFSGLMKGGVGLASVEIGGGVTVSALSVVNALGDVLDERGAILAGARSGEVFAGSTASLLAMTSAPVFSAIESTTLSVVMTDASLDKLQCRSLPEWLMTAWLGLSTLSTRRGTGTASSCSRRAAGRAMSSRWEWRQPWPSKRASAGECARPGVWEARRRRVTGGPEVSSGISIEPGHSLYR